MLRSRPSGPTLQPGELPGVTAAQEIILEVLVARHRLGEPFWPVSTQLSRTYKTLRDKGYVEIIDGNVEGTDRLMLTRAARKKLMSETYTAPLATQLATHIADSLEMSGGDPTTVRMIRKQFVKED